MSISLQTYLVSAKENVANAKLVVLGNEAADLDSMASSIAYGYLCNMQGEQQVLPVMPIPRADFILRTEAVYVFKEARINLDDVVFFDEVDLGSLLRNGAGLMLVDHNKLSPSLEKYSDHVVGILDHHKDEGLYVDASPRIIQTIGSTTSLVGIEFEKAGIAVDPDVAALLCGTILLDTVNLDPEAGRVTKADRDIAIKILPLCTLTPQDFFDNVQREKFNVAGLSTNDLLRKDYKEFQFGSVQCGIGSALLPVADWSALDSDLFAGFAQYTEARGLDVLFSMNAFANPDFSRDLVVFCKTAEEHDSLIDYLQKNGLSLTSLDFPEQTQGENGFIRFYNQGNLGISRKKLQPLLADFYKGQRDA